MKKHSFFGVRALVAGLMAAMELNGSGRSLGAGIFVPTSRRTKHKPKHRAAGNKIARQCYQGAATMRHKDGVIAATIRDNAMRLHA